MTALVTENLQLVAGAPNGISKLRELILDLAIRGKLVEHVPTDVPVSQLLADIAEARSAMSRSRKAVVSAKEAQLPFEIPQSWRWVRLGDLLSKIGAGSTPLGGKQAYVDVGVKFLRSQNVWNDGLRLQGVALISPETHARMGGTHVQPGDILFNITGASIGRCALVPDDFDTGNVSQHVTIVRPLKSETRRYLHTALMSKLVQDTVMSVQVGVSREGLSIGKLGQFFVPLPPLAEQHRIVAKVDELMALCDRLEAEQTDAEAAHAKLVEALLASLTQARDAADFRASWQQLAEHFHTLFTTEASVDALTRAVHDLALRGVLEPQLSATSDHPNAGEPVALQSRKSKLPPLTTSEIPFAAPPGWTWQRLEAITSVLTDGEHLTPPRTNDSQQVPLATAKNVRDGFIDLDRTDYVERSTAEKCWKRCKPSRGDVLMVSVGATLGRVAVMVDDREMVIVRSVALFRPVQVVPNFLALALRSGMLQEQIWARVRQSAQPCLYLSQAGQLAVPVPPVEEQQRIVQKVSVLIGLCVQLKQRLANARKHHDHVASVLVEQAIA